MLISSSEARALEVLSELTYDVRRLALAHPDAVYQPHGGACSYIKGTSYESDDEQVAIGTGCVIGQAVLVDRPVDDVLFPLTKGQPDQLGTGYIDGDVQEALEYFLQMDLGMPFFEEEMTEFRFVVSTMVRWLYRVQEIQDNRKTWGEAVERADQTVAELVRYR